MIKDNENGFKIFQSSSSISFMKIKSLITCGMGCMVDTFQCAGHIPIEECPTTLALSLNAIDIIKLFIITGYDKAHMKAALTNKDV
jgi:hypothetical protein